MSNMLQTSVPRRLLDLYTEILTVPHSYIQLPIKGLPRITSSSGVTAQIPNAISISDRKFPSTIRNIPVKLFRIRCTKIRRTAFLCLFQPKMDKGELLKKTGFQSHTRSHILAEFFTSTQPDD
ncbi:hypothetical protein CBL_07549 [Carabus blaptoides fortunei]